MTATGTANPPFAVQSEKEPGTGAGMNLFQSITCMPAYTNSSFEELRWQDYNQGRRYGSGGGNFGSAPSSMFGAQNQTSLFGAQPTTSFNQTNSGFGTNSNQQPNNAFGQPNNAFGTSNSMNNNNATPSTGLFGAGSTTSNNIFGSNQTTNNSSMFGNNNSNNFGMQPNTSSPFSSSGNFGANNNTASKPFSFGTNSQTTNGFGQAPATSNNNNSLFNNPTPASSAAGLFGTGTGTTGTNNTPGLFSNTSNNAQSTPTNAFNFGNSNTTANTGTTPSFGFGNSFGGANSSAGQKPATFGTPPVAASGMFGSTQTATGAKPFTFGAANTATQPNINMSQGTTGGQAQTSNFSNASSSGLFGSANTSRESNNLNNGFGKSTTNNLFGNSSQNTPSQGLFGGQSSQTNQNNASNLFSGQASMFGQASQNTTEQGTPSIGSNPYGFNPLFASVQGVQSPISGPLATPLIATPHKKKPSVLPHFRNSIRSPMASPKPLQGSQSLQYISPRSDRAKKPLYSFFDEELLLQTDAFSPRTDIKRLVIDRKSGENDLLSGSIDLTSKEHGPALAGHLQVKSEAPQPEHTDAVPRHAVERDAERPDKNDETVNNSPSVVAQPSKHKGDSAHRNREYWTTPSMTMLNEYSKAQLSKVKDFKIGRHGYGQISFAAPVDLSSLENVEDVAGKLVVFEGKMCIVYPDESIKPAIGKGLNVQATITLDNCFALSKDKRDPIRDTSHPRFQQHVDRLKRMTGTEFIDYLADTGTWIFRVDHF